MSQAEAASEAAGGKYANAPWKGNAKKYARNMLLQYAMFKTLGPDKWRFTGFYNDRGARCTLATLATTPSPAIS